MRCIAVLEVQRPDLDTVIVWDDGERMVAFAYLDGTTKKTRPLPGTNLEADIAEVRDSFQINPSQLIRVTDWGDGSERDRTATVAKAPLTKRWELAR